MTVLEGFKQHLSGTATAGTTEVYLYEVARLNEWLAGRPLTIDTLEGYVEWLKAGAGNGHALNPQTIAKALSAIKRYLGFSARHGNHDAETMLNTLAHYKVGPQVKEVHRAVRELVRRAQFDAALAKLADHRLAQCYGWNRWKNRAKALLYVLWGCGVRIDELRHMTETQGRELVEQGHTILTVTKGGKPRTICLATAFREHLRRHVEATPRGTLLFDISCQTIGRFLDNLDLPSCHSFRHSYITRGLEAGVREDVLRVLVGHGPRMVTHRYIHHPIESLLAAAEQIG